MKPRHEIALDSSGRYYNTSYASWSAAVRLDSNEHPPCGDPTDCAVCGERDCPFGDRNHYQKHGPCPSCAEIGKTP